MSSSVPFHILFVVQITELSVNSLLLYFIILFHSSIQKCITKLSVFRSLKNLKNRKQWGDIFPHIVAWVRSIRMNIIKISSTFFCPQLDLLTANVNCWQIAYLWRVIFLLKLTYCSFLAIKVICMHQIIDYVKVGYRLRIERENFLIWPEKRWQSSLTSLLISCGTNWKRRKKNEY